MTSIISAEYLPFVIPLLAIQVLLAIISVVDILRQKKFRLGNKWIWLVVACLFNIIGPVLYFTIGKER